MKYLVFSLLAISLFISSCNNADTMVGMATIEATIEGQAFKAEVGNVILLEGTLNMGGVGQYEAHLQFNEIEEGTFALPSTQGLIDVLFLTMEDGTVIGVGDGTYTVDNLSNSRASGSFQGTFYAIDDFMLANPVEVTNGQFDASF